MHLVPFSYLPVPMHGMAMAKSLYQYILDFIDNRVLVLSREKAIEILVRLYWKVYTENFSILYT